MSDKITPATEQVDVSAESAQERQNLDTVVQKSQGIKGKMVAGLAALGLGIAGAAYAQDSKPTVKVVEAPVTQPLKPTPASFEAPTTTEVEDEWDLGFDDELEAEKAETAQKTAEAEATAAELAQKTAEAEQKTAEAEALTRIVQALESPSP